MFEGLESKVIIFTHNKYTNNLYCVLHNIFDQQKLLCKLSS